MTLKPRGGGIYSRKCSNLPQNWCKERRAHHDPRIWWKTEDLPKYHLTAAILAMLKLSLPNSMFIIRVTYWWLQIIILKEIFWIESTWKFNYPPSPPEKPFRFQIPEGGCFTMGIPRVDHLCRAHKLDYDRDKIGRV